MQDFETIKITTPEGKKMDLKVITVLKKPCTFNLNLISVNQAANNNDTIIWGTNPSNQMITVFPVYFNKSPSVISFLKLSNPTKVGPIWFKPDI